MATPTLQDVLMEGGVFHGMHPMTMRDFDGSLRPTLVKTGLDKTCLAINFLVWKLSSLYQVSRM